MVFGRPTVRQEAHLTFVPSGFRPNSGINASHEIVIPRANYLMFFSKPDSADNCGRRFQENRRSEHLGQTKELEVKLCYTRLKVNKDHTMRNR